MDHRGVVIALMSVILSGCYAHAGVRVEVPTYPQEHIYIPKGHMPPPGQCRIWFLNISPGQQPPPGECHELERKLPPNAVLVRG